MQWVPEILSQLTDADQQVLQTSCFGPIVRLGNKVSFSSQLTHFMLLREVDTRKSRSMWFAINGQLTRFGLPEFQRVTGLNCGNYVDTDITNLEMEDVIGHKRCSLDCLVDVFNNENPSSPNKLKMAFLLILEGILLAREKKNLVRQICINLVDNLDVFNNYSWGRLVFGETMKSLRKAIGKDRNVNAYHLYGFPLAFQMWAFEALPDLASKFATLECPNATPLCLKWLSSSHGSNMPTYRDIEHASSQLAEIKVILANEGEPGVDSLGWTLENEDERIDILLSRVTPGNSVQVDVQLQYSSAKLNNLSGLSGKNKGLHVADTDASCPEEDDFVIQNKISGKLKGPKDMKTHKIEELKITGRKVGQVDEERNNRKANKRKPQVVQDKAPSILLSEPDWAKNLEKKLDGVLVLLDNVHKRQAVFETSYDTISERQERLEGIVEFLSNTTTSTVPNTECQTPFPVLDTPTENCDMMEEAVHQITQDILPKTLVSLHDPTVYPREGGSEIVSLHSLDKEAIALQDLADEDIVQHSTGAELSPIKQRGLLVRKSSRSRKPANKDLPPFTQQKQKGGRKPRIPTQPNNSFLTENQREEFYKWYKSKSETTARIQCLLNKNGRQFFSNIVEEKGWLWSEQICEMLCHIRKGMCEFPYHFTRVAVLDDWWSARFKVDVMHAFLEEGESKYHFDDNWFKVFTGKLPRYGKPMYDVDMICAPVLVGENHWIAIEVNLRAWTIYTYDSNPLATNESEKIEATEPLSLMLPELLKRSGLFARFAASFNKPLDIHPITNLPINLERGSSGIFTVKYIEFIASGREDLALICDEYIQAYREQMAYALFRRKWYWEFVKDGNN